MAPVVNGLEESYKSKIDFRWLDANSADGSQAFRFYHLLGYPSYVLINSKGEVLWKDLGELSKAALIEQLETALTNP